MGIYVHSNLVSLDHEGKSIDELAETARVAYWRIHITDAHWHLWMINHARKITTYLPDRYDSYEDALAAAHERTDNDLYRANSPDTTMIDQDCAYEPIRCRIRRSGKCVDGLGNEEQARAVGAKWYHDEDGVYHPVESEPR